MCLVVQFIVWIIFFAKNNYLMIYREKNGFLEMCSVTVTLNIRKNTQKSKFILSQPFKCEKDYVFRNPQDAI